MNRNGPVIQSSLRKTLVALRYALSQMASVNQNRYAEPLGDGEWNPLPDSPSLHNGHAQQRVTDIVTKLDQMLRGTRYDEIEFSPNEEWSLGAITNRFAIRKIVRGFVEPVYRAPVVSNVPKRVVAFFIKLPDWKDLLEREHHREGWHYHYLDSKRVRSDTILCWDTRFSGTSDVHPLFQEKHGEGKAQFKGKPNLWGNIKRRSMHSACKPDLDKWPINEFRCASMKKAQPVWPFSAVLTPRPPSSAYKGNKGRR